MAGGKAEATIITTVVKDLLGDAAEAVERDAARDAAKSAAKDAGETAAKDAAKDAGESAAKDAARDAEDTASREAGQALKDGEGGAPPGDRTTTKDPIDVATGEVLLAETDVVLPGVLPLILKRIHVSSYRQGLLFGTSWASTLDQRLEIGADGIRFAAADGTIRTYPPAFMQGDPMLAANGPARPLTWTGDGGYTIENQQAGQTLHFPAAGGTYGWRVPLTAISDRNGNRVDFVYDAQGVLSEVRHSGGQRIAVETDGPPGRHRVRALRLLAAGSADGDPLAPAGDEAGGITLVTYEYDGAGRLIAVTDSTGRPRRFSYDADGRLTGWADRGGHWYRYEYDSAGRAVRGYGPDGVLSVALAYDPEGRRTVLTDSLGRPTTYHLDERRRVVASADPLGNMTATIWDDRNRPVSRTDPLGAATGYAWDPTGNLLSVVRPDGLRTSAFYNELGKPVQVSGADGAVWRQTWDERGNLIAATDPLGATTRYGYNGQGHLISVTDPLGGTTRIEPDRAGLPITVTDPLGNTTRYRRDAFGRVTSVTDPLGGVTRFSWTVEGRLTYRVLPSGAAERWEYDGEGNPVAYTDAVGRLTRTEYGPFGTPTVRIAPDGTRLEFTHDSELRLTAVGNPQGLTWRYEYDAAGRLVRETDFGNRVLTYGHDAAGRLIARTNGAGQTTTYHRGALGNIDAQRSGDAVTTFAYDPAGRPVRATNAEADLHLTYDPLGRLTADSCNGRTMSNSYDALGRRVRRRTPSGAEAAWSYDAAGRPSALRTGGQVLTFFHDAAGREIQRRIGSGAILDQRWDVDHQLVAQTLWGAPQPAQPPLPPLPAPPAAGPPGEPRLLQHRTYAYRPDGNIVAIGDRFAGTRTFDLDRIGRVTAVRAQDWTESYAYDAAGNLTHATGEPPGTGHPAPAAAGAAVAADAQGDREYTGTLLRRAGRVQYEYDGQGRVIRRTRMTLSGRRDVWHFTWDADDRLVAVTTPAGHYWRYYYDPLGRRTGKQRFNPDGSASAERIEFAWDGTSLAEEATISWSNGQGSQSGQHGQHGQRPRPVAEIRTWTYDPGTFRPLTQAHRSWLGDVSQEAIDREFYGIITDLVGTPKELVDPGGNLAREFPDSLWGTRPAPARGVVDCPLRFPGQYHDEETGLNYNLHRYFDPATGRYESSDPIGLAGGANPYGYVANPVRKLDPSGLSETDPPLFRGTTRGWEGSPGTQRVGITPTSTDPGVATIFATHSASQYGGEGVVQTVLPGSLEGVEKYGPGYIPREAEVGVGLSPGELASRADSEISVGRARSILGEMGINIPPSIGHGDIDRVIEDTAKLSPEQIQEFMDKAGSCGG